jgi:hypothetical protein
MTAQVSETLIYQGKELMMFTTPLDPYLRTNNISFVSPHTANWRGYEGTWEIKGSEESKEGLYLVALHAHRSYEDVVGLEEIFPGFTDGVFAHWFSGEIRLPQGNQLKYVHMGYASTYEFDLFLEIKKGLVVNKRAVHNKVDANGR